MKHYRKTKKWGLWKRTTKEYRTPTPTPTKEGLPVWTECEDRRLRQAIDHFGLLRWDKVSSFVQRGKSSRACKARYEDVHQPSLTKDFWTPHVDKALMRLGDDLKPHWASVAAKLKLQCGDVPITAAQCEKRYFILMNVGPKLKGSESPAKSRPSNSDTGILNMKNDWKDVVDSVCVKTKTMRQFSHRLQLFGRKEKHVLGDGNCQFRALSDQLFGDEMFYNYVREIVISQLKSEPGLYRGFVAEDYEEFTNKLAKDREWGDNVTLQAASDVFQRRIIVLTAAELGMGIIVTPQRPGIIWDTLCVTYQGSHYNSTEGI